LKEKMANLAYRRHPIEKDKWSNFNESTNGDSINFDGFKGFATATCPQTYTLDLEKERLVAYISFRLWDGLGGPENANRSDSELKKASSERYYTFILNVFAADERRYKVYSNVDGDKGNGWFIFEFNNPLYIRKVQLECLNSTANNEFHIVSFEVYDSPDISNRKFVNAKYITSNLLVYNIESIQEFVNSALDKRSNDIASLRDNYSSTQLMVNNKIQELEKIIDASDILQKVVDFQRLAEDYNCKKLRWLWAAIISILILIVLIIISLIWDKLLESIISDYWDDDFKIFRVYSYYASKALVFSVLIYTISKFLRNYYLNFHNSALNRHKATSLLTMTTLLTDDRFKNVDSSLILAEALKTIFSHQSTGISSSSSKEDGGIINNILDNSFGNGSSMD
jgi:hypothetical protein